MLAKAEHASAKAECERLRQELCGLQHEVAVVYICRDHYLTSSLLKTLCTFQSRLLYFSVTALQ